LIIEYARENDIFISDLELEHAYRRIIKEYSENTFHDALLRGYVNPEQWRERLRNHLLLQRVISEVTKNIALPSYDEIKQYFETHRNEFSTSRMISFKQIVTVKKEDAELVLDKLNSGENFEKLARSFSIAPEAEKGGYVGWVFEGQLDESMEKELFSLSPGTCSSVVETPYGYHIFQVQSIKPGGARELPLVMEQIERLLYQQNREKQLMRALINLREKYKVVVRIPSSYIASPNKATTM
jgi:parvulin-like peptidyl-prolyl isomerase